MTAFQPRTFTIALIAQIVFCLVGAPILAAERFVAPQTQSDKHPDSQPVVQAAFDATDVRPEEVSDAGRKRGKSRASVGCECVGSALADAGAADSQDERSSISHPSPRPPWRTLRKPLDGAQKVSIKLGAMLHACVDMPYSRPCASFAIVPSASQARPLNVGIPAVQTTGPPMI
jgi:hypothetical protein